MTPLYKNGISKNCKFFRYYQGFLDFYQDLLLKNGLKSMFNQKKIISQTKKSELKHQCYDQIYATLMMSILFCKEILLFKVIMILIKEIKILHLKTIHHVLIAFQKLMA